MKTNADQRITHRGLKTHYDPYVGHPNGHSYRMNETQPARGTWQTRVGVVREC